MRHVWRQVYNKFNGDDKSSRKIAAFAWGGQKQEANVVPVGQAAHLIAQKGFPSTTNIIYKQNYSALEKKAHKFQFCRSHGINFSQN